MRLLEYIETQRGKTISKIKAEELLNTKHSKAFNSKTPIYRGVGGYGDYVYIDPSKSKSPRVSANTSNYYTLIMDNSPEWKEYPKRSESLICTTDKNYADGFGGQTYFVYPQNNSIIGICPTPDIWGAAGRYYNFGSIGRMINRTINTEAIKVDRADYTYESMVKIFKLVDENKEELYQEVLKYHSEHLSFIKDYIKSGKTFLNFIEQVLNPDRCGFTFVKAGDSLPNSENEVWMSGPCILVKA